MPGGWSFDESVPDEAALNKSKALLRLHEFVLAKVEQQIAEPNLPLLTPELVREMHGIVMEYEPWHAPGHFRIVDVTVGVHEPPPWAEVSDWTEGLCQHLGKNTEHGSLYLAAYTMWFLCWVHPFSEGNGRVARAASYLVLSASEGVILPGTLTIHQQIQDDEKTLFEYLDGLHEADRAWKHEQRIELRGLVVMLERLLLTQLQS